MPEFWAKNMCGHSSSGLLLDFSNPKEDYYNTQCQSKAGRVEKLSFAVGKK
jgi:hypothetical protein